MSKTPPPTPPIAAASGGHEPEIDRAKLLAAWTSNAETQRAVLRRSSIVGTLAVLATLAQAAVAWQVLRQVDAVAAAAGAEIEEMKGLLRTSLAATTAVQAVEIEERAAEVDALFAAEPEPEKPAAPGTVTYRAETASEVLSKAAWRAKHTGGRKAGGSRGEGFGLASGAAAEPAPEAAAETPPSQQEFLEKRREAQEQVEAALEQLKE
jgi:hypothetical protein